MHPWDSAASAVIIEEAGGRYTDWQGIATAHAPTALASNGLVHEELLAILGRGSGG
jgi:histidinol-phosphatase